MKAMFFHITRLAVVLAFFLLSEACCCQNVWQKLKGLVIKSDSVALSEKQQKFIPDSDKAVAYFDRVYHNYGEIEEGADSKVSFTVRNRGAEELKIISVESPCGCVVSEYPKLIASGKSAEIKVSYNTNLLGEIQRSIVVQTSDPERENTVLFLSGEVVRKDIGKE